MITWLQRHKRWLVITIWISTIAFVGAGFVGWGSYDYGKQGAVVAVVGDREVSVEEYLEYVVPSEMSSDFGVEPLKVQSIAARTYTLKNLSLATLRANGYHIDDTPKYQAYNLVDKNSYSTQAVKETQGMVLVSQGKYIDAQYYSTTSGFGVVSDQIIK